MIINKIDLVSVFTDLNACSTLYMVGFSLQNHVDIRLMQIIKLAPFKVALKTFQMSASLINLCLVLRLILILKFRLKILFRKQGMLIFFLQKQV